MQTDIEKHIAYAPDELNVRQHRVPFPVANRPPIASAEAYKELTNLLSHAILPPSMCVRNTNAPITTFHDVESGLVTRAEDIAVQGPHHHSSRTRLVQSMEPEALPSYSIGRFLDPKQDRFRGRWAWKIEGVRMIPGSMGMDERSRESGVGGQRIIQDRAADTQIHQDAAKSSSTQTTVYGTHMQVIENISLPGRNFQVRFAHPVQREDLADDLEYDTVEQLYQVLKTRQDADVRSWPLSSCEPEFIRLYEAREISLVAFRVWMWIRRDPQLDRDGSRENASTECAQSLEDRLRTAGHTAQSTISSGTGQCRLTVPETQTQRSVDDQQEHEDVGHQKGFDAEPEGNANNNAAFPSQKRTTDKFSNETTVLPTDEDHQVIASEAPQSLRSSSVSASDRLTLDENRDLSARGSTRDTGTFATTARPSTPSSTDFAPLHQPSFDPTVGITKDAAIGRSRSRHFHHEDLGCMINGLTRAIDEHNQFIHTSHLDAEEGWDARVHKGQVPYDRGKGSPSPTRKVQDLRAMVKQVGLGMEECVGRFW